MGDVKKALSKTATGNALSEVKVKRLIGYLNKGNTLAFTAKVLGLSAKTVFKYKVIAFKDGKLGSKAGIPRKRNFTSSDVINTIRKLEVAGYSGRQISKIMKISHSTTIKYMVNVSLRGNKPLDLETVANIISLRKQGISLLAVAKKLGISIQTVFNYDVSFIDGRLIIKESLIRLIKRYTNMKMPLSINDIALQLGLPHNSVEAATKCGNDIIKVGVEYV